jgi:hypothetical protein
MVTNQLFIGEFNQLFWLVSLCEVVLNLLS